MDIKITPAQESELPILKQLTELYEYDFSEFTKDDVSPSGFYNFPYMQNLIRYWTDTNSHPFLVRVDNQLAGFVLVSMNCLYTPTADAHVIDEFFIMRKYRGLGVGKFAAGYMFDLFPGAWELCVLHVNKPALAFWEKVLGEYTGGEYAFHADPVPNWDGVGFTFWSNKRG